MFSEITRDGVKWEDGKEEKADVILWNTGFKGALEHLKPVLPREENGGIIMAGRLATMVAREPRIARLWPIRFYYRRQSCGSCCCQGIDDYAGHLAVSDYP
jgi:NAD(P)H-nitrite reductase large subunit